MATTTLHPAADGYYTDWEDDSGVHYQHVDDDPHDSGSSYLQAYNGITAANIKPFLRLNSTDNYGMQETLPDTWTIYTEEIDRPGGGSWSKSDLLSVEMAIRSWVGFETYDDDSFTTDSDEVATIPDGDVIEKVEVQFVGQKVGTKTQWSQCTAVRLIVTHIEANHPAPTEIEIDHQSSQATNVSETPKFTAVFNGLNSTDVAADVYVQVSEDDSFSSGGLVYDSDWAALSSPGCDDGDRCEGIIYGTGDSSAGVLSSHPPDDKYYVRMKFRDDSSSAIESEWSDTLSGEPSEFKGINRDWALSGYAFRRKLYVDTDHAAAIPAGWSPLSFSFKTGERTVAATNGAFNEAVQASGGFQIEGYGSKLFYVYLSEPDPTDAQGDYAHYIMESSDGGETWSTPVKLASSNTPYDSHYFPTLVVDKLGYLHVTLGAHNGSFRYMRSTNSADISSWSEPTTITGFSGTYTKGILVPTKGGAHGRVYWFWRNSSTHKETFIYSDDGGSTWSSVHDFIVDTSAWAYRVYCYGYRYDLNAERLHIAYTHNHSGDVEKGVWHISSDLDETDSNSGDYGFNIWHWADGDVAGYSQSATGDAVDYNEGEAIIFGADHLARTFIEMLELDASGNPIVFWEQKIIGGAPTDETYLVCATWSGSSWETHYISDEVNRMLRVRRSSIGCQRDRDNVIRAIMPVRANTWWHFNPTADVDSIDITRKSEASNYLEIDEGPTDCDKDGSYFDVGTDSGGAQASFSCTTDMIDGTREIFTLEIRAIVKHLGTNTSCYLYVEDGSVEDDSASISITNSTYLASAEKSATWDVNPFTSQPWTKSDLDSLQFGIKQAGANEFRVTRVFARAQYTLQSDAEWGASEIFELTSSDDGATWQMSRELSRNSGIGVPMMNNSHHLHNNRMHVIWTSGFDLFYFTDKRFGLAQFSGDDVRIVYAGSEIDRVFDYANKNETLISVKCQAEIPANRRAGPNDYYLYAGNPNETAAAKSDPHGVYDRDFQNWEQYDDNEDPDGKDGWTVTNGTGYAYASPPSHANKVGAGELSVECYPSSGLFAMEKTIGSGLTNVQIDIFMWMESAGGDDRAWVEFEDSGGGIFGAGLDRGELRAAYKVDSSWNNSSLYANYKSMNHLRLRVTSAGCSAWWNGNEIVLEYNESDAIVSVDKLRLACNALSYFDFSRVGYSWETGGVSDPVIEIQSEEWRGLRIEATLLGRGSDSFIVDAKAWGLKMGWVTANADAVDPTVVLGSITVEPTATAVSISAADPTVVLGSTTATASVAVLVTTSAPTVILGSTVAAPEAVAALTSAVDPSVVLGSLLLTPSTVAIVASVGQPTVVLGSVTITVTVSAFASSSDPTVHLGSTSSTPAAVVTTIGSLNPQVVLGSLTITPDAASCLSSASNPTLHFGSTSASPDATTATASVGDPTVILGAITLSPDPVSALVAAADGDIVLGSLAIIPTATSCLVAVIAPQVELGSTTAIPTAVAVLTATVDPTVVLGSITLSAAAVNVEIEAVDPTVIIGAIIFTPATVSATATGADPTVILGSVTIEPASLTAIADAVDAAIQLSSTTASPSVVAAIATVQAPTVIIGAITISPAPVSTTASVSAPTVVLGSTSASPTATTAVVAAADPSVILGSISLSPSSLTVEIAAVDPSVIIGAVTITPAATDVIVTASDPTIVLSSTTAEPSAVSTTISTIAPTVLQGSLSLSPEPSAAVIAAADPVVVIGAVVVTPGAVTAQCSAVDPNIVLSSMIVQPGIVIAICNGANPTVELGSISLTPAAAQAICNAVDPTVDMPAGIIVSPETVVAIAGAADPSTILGSIQISPTASVVYTNASDPILVLGSLSISAEAVSAIAGTAAPVVVFGALIITPTSSQAVTVAVSPGIVLSSTVSTPATVSALADVLAPTVLLTGVVLILPDGRTVIVAEEDRRMAVATEDRILAVPGEDRTFKVSADERGVLVRPEDRTSKISRSN